MAALAQAVSVTPMALYKHFPNKEAILDAVAAFIFGRFRNPSSGAPWEDRLAEWVSSLRDLLADYPEATSLIAARGLISPAWYPVLASLSEIVLDAGVPDRQHALACHVTGSIIFGVIRSAPPISRAEMDLPPSNTPLHLSDDFLVSLQKVDGRELLNAAVVAATEYLRAMSALHQPALATHPPPG